MAKQLSFQNTNWRHRYSHGGSLRRRRAGRGARPLSSREPIHLVLKANKDVIRGGFRLHRRFALIHHILQKYLAKFFIKVEQVSIQGDHIHLLIRTSRRSLYQHFFRVLAGQIAQRFEKEGLLSVAGSKVATKTFAPTSANLAVSSVTSLKQNAMKGTVNTATDTPTSEQDAGKGRGVTGTPAGFESKPGLRRKAEVVIAVEGGEVREAKEDNVVPEMTAVREGNLVPEVAVLLGKVKINLWKHRPFTRVVKGYRAYKTVQDYIQLNEREALGDLLYRPQRLRGLSSADWEILWSL